MKVVAANMARKRGILENGLNDNYCLVRYFTEWYCAITTIAFLCTVL